MLLVGQSSVLRKAMDDSKDERPPWYMPLTRLYDKRMEKKEVTLFSDILFGCAIIVMDITIWLAVGIGLLSLVMR